MCGLLASCSSRQIDSSVLCGPLLLVERVQIRPGMAEGYWMVARGFRGSDESKECPESPE